MTVPMKTPPNGEVPNGPFLGFVPTTLAEAMKLADIMAEAKLVPAALQKSPADCLMVIQQAARWQMDPFAVAQECSVIQSKLMHSGKLVAAVVNTRGNLTQRLAFDYHGQGDERTVLVSGQLQGEPELRTVEVIYKNAKTNNSVWIKQPDQQLAYHGARVWARRHTPELMLGVYSPEEFDAPAGGATPRPAPRARPNVMIPHDAETGEIIDESPHHEPSAPRGKDVFCCQCGTAYAVEPDRCAKCGGNGFQYSPPHPSDTATGAADQGPPAKTSSVAAGVPEVTTLSLEDEAREAARRGKPTFDVFWRRLTLEAKTQLKSMGTELRKLMDEAEPHE